MSIKSNLEWGENASMWPLVSVLDLLWTINMNSLSGLSIISQQTDLLLSIPMSGSLGLT